MVHLMVTYTVRPENVATVEAVIGELLRIVDADPDVIDYDVFQRTDDQFSFVHVMSFLDEAAEDRHQNSQAVRTFTQQLYPLCAVEPIFTGLVLIESRNKTPEV